ncbi:uncharacterized protein [Musca autumnalis]|uniref:uncharacterized protein n=1 Tax=Musca autumnalis TaxID=221902 RepID=UPI003CF5BA58
MSLEERSVEAGCSNGGKLFAATLAPINLKAPNLAKEWNTWHTQFKIFLRASDLESQPNERKVALLLHHLGSKSLDIFNSFNLDVDVVEYDDLVSKMQSYFVPQSNIVMERHTFFTYKQQEEQTLDEFVTVLKNLSLNCEFKELRTQLVRDIFICGLNSKHSFIRERLLTEDGITLEKAVMLAKNMETARINSSLLQNDDGVDGLVNIIRKCPKTHRESSINNYNSRYENNNNNHNMESKNCTKCGLVHKMKCPAEGIKCHACGKMNHFARMCVNKKKFVNQMLADEDTDDEDLFLGAVIEESKKAKEWNVEEHRLM